MLRIGQGFDLHKLVYGRPLILAGVTIPHEYGLDGHSDADVLLHAVIDALIGALALGDIGKFFPDTDERYRGANSRELLKIISANIMQRGFKINNLDTTIIIEQPKLRNYIDNMRANLAQDLCIDLDQVSIKAKTSEGVGIVGRREAVVAQAIVLLIQ